MSSQNPQVNCIKLRKEQVLPKLLNNRKLELRWGSDYYQAVNNAVFNNQESPHMPTEPPASIKEDVDKTGYVCKQCRDCFRFLSSIEEHTSRRSWVLGYWCELCFTIKCNHVLPNEPMCSDCRNIKASKHAYFTEKRVRRNLKKAVTRVFYNQCQFFAHLRMHGIVTVDLSEVMLMPLPSGIQRVDYGRFDRLCKALMETMFIRRIHIMDWLRELNVEPSRWNTLLDWMESKEKTPISDIINRYSEDCLNLSDLAERTRKESLVGNGNDASFTSYSDKCPFDEKDPLAEDDDSPNDIAFVDCGPTPSHAVITEFPDVNTSNDSASDRTRQSDKKRDKSHVVEKKLNDLSTTKTAANRKPPRVLTIRTPKSLSLSTIMKHLPIDGISAKNILVVADETKRENQLSPVTSGRAVKNPSIAAKLKSKEKSSGSIVERNNSKINCSTSSVATNQRVKPIVKKSQSFSEQMSLHGRIVFQNGRKYIIRHVSKSKSQSILQDSIIKKLRNPQALASPLPGAKVPLLPKAVSATSKITPVSKIVQSRQGAKLSPKLANTSILSMSAAKRNLTSDNGKARITKMQRNLLTKCREAFMNDLRRVPKSEIESYIKNLKEINKRYWEAMGFNDDSVLETNARAMLCFEKAAKIAPTKERSSQESEAQEIFEKHSREWEKRMKETNDEKICDTCEKIMKPESYVVGMSNPATDETIYCQCYNTVCHICKANQGSVLQLKAHVKWHKGEKPYMCPNCSIVFSSIVELEVHVWTLCFHPMARYIYGCGVCEIEGILDMESVAKHYMLLHTRRKVICAECKIEYTGLSPSHEVHAKHFLQHHPEIQDITEPKRLLVCNLKQCIIRPELFRAHLSGHVGVLKWIYYKCPFCSVITQGPGRNKSLMREHLVKNHLDRMCEIVSKDSLPIILNGMKCASTNAWGQMITRVNKVDPTGPKILDARTITPASFELGTDGNSDETILSHDDENLPKILDVRSEALEEFQLDETKINDYELEILSVKSVADDSLNSSATDAVKTMTIDVDSSLIDEQAECENSSSSSHDDVTVISIQSNSELDTDVKDFIDDSQLEEFTSDKEAEQKPRRIALNSPSDVEAKPIFYNCHLCGQLINTSWSVVKNHFDTQHSSDYEIFTVSPNIPRVTRDSIDETYNEDSNGNNKKRKMEVVPASSSKRRKRWGPKKYFERPGSPNFGILVKPEPVQEIEGSFRCKKCDQLFQDRSILRNHIAMQHRIKGQYLICLECGENFVVVPSLQMHLKALHGIQDPITYLTKNTAYAPEILDDIEENEKLTESNQCYVCMAVFEDKSALDKHIRVHGMAFLRRKRFEALKALKSCQKVADSTVSAPSTGSNDDKPIIVNDVVKFIKKEEEHEDNSGSSVQEENKSKNEIEQVETIKEIKDIESSPIT